MTRKAKPKPDMSSLELRFEFVGDAVAPGDQRALKSVLYEVEDRLTGVSRCLKLWRKTGSPVDEDLRGLWKHEMRQLQRVMAYAGARDVIVDVLEFVEDSENFGVLLEHAGAPLAARRRRVGPNHWLRNVSASRSRALIWRNVRRLVTALGIVHAQGLVHGKLSADVIMTDASDDPDFQLGGFEWSLWVSADSADKAHAALGPEGSAHRASIYSFAEDWRALGHLGAECLGAKIKANGEMVAAGDVNIPINMSASERALLKRMVMPTRFDHLDAEGITRAVDDIIANISQATATQAGTFILSFNPNDALGEAIYNASEGAIPIDELREQLDWIRADLDGGATLTVPRPFSPTTTQLRLLTDSMAYRLRPFWQDGVPVWDIAVCADVEPRSQVLGLGRFDEHELSQPIAVASVGRDAGELRARLGPAVLDWGVLAGGGKEEAEAGPVETIRKGLLLVQVIEAVTKALEVYPIEVMDTGRQNGRRYAVLRAAPANDRDRFAKKVGMTETANSLRRMFEEDARDSESKWRISQSSSLGASQRTDVIATFVDIEDVHGRHGYRFEIDEELPPNGPFFLRTHRDYGSERVISRRLKNIKALDTRVDLAEMLDDPWRVRRMSRDKIDIKDEKDKHYLDLDEPKQKALVALWGTLPSYFVVGPPGVGKTKLATETVRRRFATDRATRVFICAQGHDALDNLQENINRELADSDLNDVIVVRSTTPERRQSSDEDVHLTGLSYLEELLRCRLIGDAPVALRERVTALQSAAKLLSREKDKVSRDDRSGLQAISSLVLDGANIVISTANSADVERLVEAREQFDWVVVEEAAKATGPELIGALMLSGRRLLIGDHNQLPPFGADQLITILSDHSLVIAALNLADSLVAPLMREGELDEMTKLAADADKLLATSSAALRLLEPFRTVIDDDERLSRENPNHRSIAATLTLQRRMDPAIARIISNAFYRKTLDTLPKRLVQAETTTPPFTHFAPLPASPVVVVNFPHVSASGSSHQPERGRPRWHNPSEVDAVVNVLRHVRARDDTEKQPTLAVLSPYKAQVDKLQNRITPLLRTELAHLSNFSTVRAGHGFIGTVDSFQGSEADLVIVSLVRNNQRTGLGALGFLRDKRRMNVALSRAKSQLVIVGSLSFLRESVRGVNPDATDHRLSFLTDMVDTIDELCTETRGEQKLRLASIIAPETLRPGK